MFRDCATLVNTHLDMAIKIDVDDAHELTCLRADVGDAAIGPKTYGQRIVAALVPRYFKDVQAMHFATKISYQTLHSWKTGVSDPRMSQLGPVNEAIGFDVVTLLVSNAPRDTVREHPDWPRALAEARAHRGRKLPSYAFDMAGETSGAKLPERIDADFVADLAEFWWRHATDDELSVAETEAARREMEEIDRGRKR